MKQQTIQLGKRSRGKTENDMSTKKSKVDSEDTSKSILESDSDKGPNIHGPSSPLWPFVPALPLFDVKSAFSRIEGKIIRKDPGLDLLYFKHFLKAPGRTTLFKYLLEELPWYRVKYQARGIQINTPRWTCVWGKDDQPDSQAKWKQNPREIPEALKILMEHVEERTGSKFNFVLCNYYADGKDSISWHSDDESFLGSNPTIASLSLGSLRDFVMKHKTDKLAKQEKWTLESGDMIVMRGTTQAQWLHTIPKRASAGGRMNLTFRRAINAAGTNNYYHFNVGSGPAHHWQNGSMVEAKK